MCYLSLKSVTRHGMRIISVTERVTLSNISGHDLDLQLFSIPMRSERSKVTLKHTGVETLNAPNGYESNEAIINYYYYIKL